MAEKKYTSSTHHCTICCSKACVSLWTQCWWKHAYREYRLRERRYMNDDKWREEVDKEKRFCVCAFFFVNVDINYITRILCAWLQYGFSASISYILYIWFAIAIFGKKRRIHHLKAHVHTHIECRAKASMKSCKWNSIEFEEKQHEWINLHLVYVQREKDHSTVEEQLTHRINKKISSQ